MTRASRRLAFIAAALLPAAAAHADSLVSCNDATGQAVVQYIVKDQQSRRLNSPIFVRIDGQVAVSNQNEVSQYLHTDAGLHVRLDNASEVVVLELTGTRREANVYRAQLRRFDNGTLIAPVLNLTCTVTPL
ncbi:MAG: hypothetical protein SF069_04425 [Phycisphaerae bacterium]|nr:hypothetical protein [Phycisphaerae bacterium]